jgi:Tfp pilus assembly protein PilV
MTRQQNDAGFSLTEAVISSAVMTLGALGVASMFLYGTRMQSTARYASTATALANTQLERLRVLPPSAAERQVGGDLTEDRQDHFATNGTYRLRWVVANGPAGTYDITVRAVSTDGYVSPAIVRSLIWR